MAKAQSVYIIRSESGLVKIGIAFDPDSRRKELQTGNGEKLHLIKTFAESEGIARFVEHAAKYILAHKRTNGEWFSVIVEEASYVIETSSWIVNFCYKKGGITPFKYKNGANGGTRAPKVVEKCTLTKNVKDNDIAIWILDKLSDGPKEVRTLLHEGQLLGWPQSTMYDAKLRIGVKHYRENGSAWWTIKKSDDEMRAVDAWLVKALSNGPKLASSIISDAESAGIPWRTVYNARSRLKIHGNRDGRVSTWSLPEPLRIVSSR